MFLVCKDVLYGLNENSYIQRKDSNVILTIPDDDGTTTVFSFDDFPIDSFGLKTILLKDVSVRSSKKQTSICSSKSKPGTIYALIRVANCIPDDVFINKKHSRNFELIKKIRYTTLEPDLGSYTASVYFVKITLKPDEFVHVYFASTNAPFLKEHLAIYCDYDMEITVTENLKTFVPNNAEFMSLSELDSIN